MSTGLICILVLLAFILSIAIGNLKNVNIGVLAFAFSLIIGCCFSGMKLNTIISLWPVNTFFMLMAITLFYGFAVENGTLKLISDTLLYVCRNAGWAVPFVIFLIGFLVSAAGAGSPATCAVLAPLAMAIAYESNYPRIPIMVSVHTGTLAGGAFLFSQGGTTLRGYIEDMGGQLSGQAVAVVNGIFLSNFISCLAFLIPFFFIYRCYQYKSFSVNKPEPATKEQKINIALILATIIVLIVPNLLNNYISNPVLKKITGWCDIKFVAIIGAALCAILRLADEKEVIRKRVPWNTLIMIAGVSTLVGVANSVGCVDILSNWVKTAVPAPLIAPAFAIVAGILSLFSGALSVVCPLFFPLIPALAEATGINPVVLYAAVYTGASSTGISPLSTGGSMMLANSHGTPEQDKLMFRDQFIIAGVFVVFVAILCVFKVYSIFGI